MRNSNTNGFTLIELLIVIAIIGILAAVLIPNLMNARVQAQNRAAQAYSSQVFTALTAVLASDVALTPAVIDAAITDGATGAQCGAGAAEVDSLTITPTGGTATTYQYGWPAAPANVTNCTVTGTDATGRITVAIETNTNGGPYTNGAE